MDSIPNQLPQMPFVEYNLLFSTIYVSNKELKSSITVHNSNCLNNKVEFNFTTDDHYIILNYNVKMYFPF